MILDDNQITDLQPLSQLTALEYLSVANNKIQSIDCGTESSKYYKKLNESVKNNHQNEFSKYLEDSNDRKDTRFKVEDTKVIPKSIFGANNSKICNYKTENSSNI